MIAMIALVAASGCAGETGDDEEDTGEGSDAVSQRQDVNRLVDEDALRGGRQVTVEKVQAFLQREGSFLARHRDRRGRSAARVIVESSRAHGVNPVYMLARIQTESQLVESGSSANLSAATGCACPDGGACSRAEAGFVNQVECAAELVEDYYAELAREGETRSGWAVGRAKSTLDPCSIKPANKATAVLYTYTPWVGAGGRQCRKSGVGGSTLVAQLYAKYAVSLR
jgi:hypothetical protein